MDEEIIEVVDGAGRVVGLATRKDVHADPRLLHRVVHLLVFDGAGRLLLQKRSRGKETAPGRWDTSVGGHVARGEDVAAAVRREAREELGLDASAARLLYTWIYRGAAESEMVCTYALSDPGPFHFDRGEIDEVRFWTATQIEEKLGRNVFSAQFEAEYALYRRKAGEGALSGGSGPGG